MPTKGGASMQRWFLALPDMKVPDNFVRIGRKTLQECAAECSANCSCVAYAYATLNGSTANGDSTRCLVWIGDHQLVDTQKMGVLPYSTTDADTQDTLYLRVASLSALLLLPALSISDDRLAPGKRLSPGTTIISDGGAFTLGFFSPSNSTPEKLYLGIWYNNIPSLTVVWVANREIPAVSSSASSLALINNSDLVLSDANGHVLWTTNTTTAASSSPSPNATGSVAVLMNTGNLIAANTSIIVYMAYVDTVDEMSLAFTVSDGAPPIQYVMSYSGTFKLRVWNQGSSEWAVLTVSPDNYECSRCW
nr:unnamed protein product [Digitaria exilis]